MHGINSDNSPIGQPFTAPNQTDLTDLLGPIETHGNACELLDLEFDLTLSGCDLPIAVSVFKDVKAKEIEANRLSLRQIRDWVQSTTAPEKSKLPLLKLSTFGTSRTAQGSLRHNDNLTSVSGIEGDYDAGSITPQDAAARLRRAGVSALIYTTSRHTHLAPRWRVLVPLSTTAPPEAREALCAQLNGALGGILAKESFSASQPYYFGGLTGIPAETFLVDGKPLDQVRNLVEIRPQPKPVKSSTSLDDLLRTPADPSEIQRALDCITLSKGDYFLWLTIGQALHSEFSGSEAGLELWHEWSKLQIGYKNQRDLEKRWDGFKVGGGVTIDTLFYHGRGFGYSPDWETLFDDLGPDDDLGPKAEQEKPETSTLRFLTPDDCSNSPSRGYLIKGLFAPRDVACIFGAPGAGKSLIAPFLGYMVAQEQEAFQMRTKGGGVFYVAAEDSHGMRGRVGALRRKYGDAPAFKLVEGVSRLLPEAGEKRAADLQALLDAAKAQRPALIFIDTLAIAFGSFEENSAEAMNRIVCISRALTTWGAAVVLIHHDTKSESGTPRGHSVLNGALDVALHVKRDATENVIRGKLTKNRNGSCERDIAFVIATEDFGCDEDGDALVYPLCNPLIGAPRITKPLRKTEQAALDLLEREGGRLLEADFKSALMNGRELSASDDPKSRRDMSTRAIRNLVLKGVITWADGSYSVRDYFDELPDPLGANMSSATQN